jgi:hypothetical protein
VPCVCRSHSLRFEIFIFPHFFYGETAILHAFEKLFAGNQRIQFGTYAQAIVGDDATPMRHWRNKCVEDVERQSSHAANEQQLIAHNVSQSSRLESASDLVRALINELTSGKDVFSKSIVLTLARQLKHTEVQFHSAHEHQREKLVALFNSISPAVQVCAHASEFD